MRQTASGEQNELYVGKSARRTELVTSGRIEEFAAVSGNENPLHHDYDHAEETMFGERIAHGMLAAGFISATLTDLVDPADATVVYLGQSLEFFKPVYVDDEVTVETSRRGARGVRPVRRRDGRYGADCPRQKERGIARSLICDPR